MTTENKPYFNNHTYKHSSYLVNYAKARSEKAYPRVMEAHAYGLNLPEGSKISPHASVYTNELGQDIPCNTELYVFIMELKKYIPDADFLLPQRDYLSRRGNVVTSLVVYRPGDIFALGEIGYYEPTPLKESLGSSSEGAWQDCNMTNDAVYVVCSPYIDNARYREDSKGAVCKTATDLKTAIRNAKKYLRTYSPSETGDVLAKGYVRVFRDEFNKLEREVAVLRRKLMYEEALMDKVTAEIHNITTNQTSKVMDSEVIEFVTQFEQAKQALRTAQSRSVNTTFVMVGRSGAVVTIPFATPCVGDKNLEPVGEPVVYESVESAPEELVGATAVLSMVKTGEYVEGVGMCVNERAYWVGA